MNSLLIVVIALGVILLVTLAFIGLNNPLVLVALLVGVGIGFALRRLGKSGR